LFAVHTGKKKDFVKSENFFFEFTQKSVKFPEFTWIHVKNREFGSTVNEKKKRFNIKLTLKKR
jgi:hypothetical protein